jgi:hypothetical protein
MLGTESLDSTRRQGVDAFHSYLSLALLYYFFLAYFPYFEKLKVGLYGHHAVCVSSPINL